MVVTALILGLKIVYFCIIFSPKLQLTPVFAMYSAMYDSHS